MLLVGLWLPLTSLPAEYATAVSSNVNVYVVSATPAFTVSLVAVANSPAITALTYNLKVVLRALYYL